MQAKTKAKMDLFHDIAIPVLIAALIGGSGLVYEGCVSLNNLALADDVQDKSIVKLEAQAEDRDTKDIEQGKVDVQQSADIAFLKLSVARIDQNIGKIADHILKGK